MPRMIRPFASEYTSKSSSSQDSLQPNGTEDQNLPQAPSAGPVPAASAQNPVLSQLLMADQDSPLDLTIRKPEAEPSEQDGVLDLSFKKSRASGSLSHRNSQACPATPMKGLGGPDPLDYISMYRNVGCPAQDVQEHWHYVSFGLSDLYGDNRVRVLKVFCKDCLGED
ncbi:ligand-dependent corepressor-like [Conger conger]|uniref:ligand-dependent corepressor-like n=1 Tax=Conger conger TaxID=82655 RepID=UPI002A59BD41|nr:ligand-dependent corepressor-like [Conger conger]